jgi:hypothetical protein
MLPLQAIAAGLILMVFDLNVGDPQIDLVPDPVGWAAMFYGAGRLPATWQHRRLLVGLAAVAGVISLFLWIPGFGASISAADESLLWALDLPASGFVGVLAYSMMTAATAGGDGSAHGWWLAVLIGTGLTLVLPVLVYGAPMGAVVLFAVAVALGTVVTCIVLCFRHARRPWVDGPTVLAGS